jgi:hypothetical protein
MIAPFSRWMHPRFDSVEAFAYGTADERQSTSVRHHLEECSRCRGAVRELRALRADASEANVPPMSSDLRARILMQADGSARIIPVYDENSAPRSTRRWPTYVGAAAVVISVITLLPTRGLDASASAGQLALSQTSFGPAPSLNVRYVAGAMLDGSDRVMLRVASYRNRELRPEMHDSPLARTGDQIFSGTVTLPDGAVFAQYTVVSLDGTHVDDNDARGWAGTMSDASGRPLYDGLWVRRAVESRINPESASAAAKAMWEFHPNNPGAARFALSDALQLAGSARADSVLSMWRPAIVALSARHAAATPDAAAMWELAMLGGEMRDTSIVRYWRARMMKEHPRDPGTIQQRVFAVSERNVPKQQIVAELERIHEESGGQSIQLLSDGFDMAVQYGDSATIARWGDRLVAFARGYESNVSTAYATLPAFRATGASLLRKSLAEIPPVPATDWQKAVRARATEPQRTQGQWQLYYLGRALFDAGQLNAARDTLRRAASLGWDIRSMRTLGDAELAAGDTTRAIEAFAWVSADPRTSLARADSLRVRTGATARSAKWDAAVAEGRTIIDAITLRSAIRRKFDATTTFATADRQRLTVADAIANAPLAVIAFVSRNCGPSLADLAALSARTRELAQRGIPVITLAEEAPSEGLSAALARHGFTGRLAYDDRGVVSRAMRQVGTPQYFVVEGGNMIRFDARRIDDVIPFIDATSRAR